MKAYRKSAITVGTLFLIALILNLIASEILNPILSSPDYLADTFSEKNKIVLANLLNFICAIAMIFIPVVLFSVVRDKFKMIASGYIVFRALEGILFIYLAVKSLSFISLSKAYIHAGPGSISTLQTIGESLHAEIQWATMIYIIIFTLGGATFYYLLYKSRLIPRFLSVWGGLAIVLLFVRDILAIFSLGIFDHMPLMKGMVYFAPPIALNELVLGIWLIAKGFNSSTADSKAEKQEEKDKFLEGLEETQSSSTIGTSF